MGAGGEQGTHTGRALPLLTELDGSWRRARDFHGESTPSLDGAGWELAASKGLPRGEHSLSCEGAGWGASREVKKKRTLSLSPGKHGPIHFVFFLFEVSNVEFHGFREAGAGGARGNSVKEGTEEENAILLEREEERAETTPGAGGGGTTRRSVSLLEQWELTASKG
ncbi:unnamed protein product [Closterium sp. Yama58-4]|nr:unnamed protein product [Closterium sp. Yama58-4]